MACSHCTGPGTGQGTGIDGFLYYSMYCTHHTVTGTETGNHCFLLCPSLSLSRSRSRAVQCVWAITGQHQVNVLQCDRKQMKHQEMKRCCRWSHSLTVLASVDRLFFESLRPRFCAHRFFSFRSRELLRSGYCRRCIVGNNPEALWEGETHRKRRREREGLC